MLSLVAKVSILGFFLCYQGAVINCFPLVATASLQRRNIYSCFQFLSPFINFSVLGLFVWLLLLTSPATTTQLEYSSLKWIASGWTASARKEQNRDAFRDM